MLSRDKKRFVQQIDRFLHQETINLWG